MASTRTEQSAGSADEAMQRLIDGNERFLRGSAQFPRLQKEILAELAKGQRPYATILGCSDSRVPPEVLFGAGLGELFVVRVAGNVLLPGVVGSLQYAGTHLNTPLFVVLGHEDCGAVKAAIESKFQGVEQRSRIQVLVDSILPGLSDVNDQLPPRVRLSMAVEANVRWTIRQIIESPEGRARLAEGRMKIVGAIYEITSGRVRFLT